MNTQVHNHYLALQNSGELEQIFPNSKGNWEQDKKSFIKLYNENIKIVLDYEKGEENFLGDNFIDDSIFPQI